MAGRNGFVNSDDELFVDALADPAPFTFQSDLSDDDVPGPLPLDEIATATLATLNGTLGLGSPPPPPPPPDDGGSQPAREEKKGIVGTVSPANGVADVPEDKLGRGTTRVSIEVHLPWLSPAQRASYTKVEVEDYRPLEGGYRESSRRRRTVSLSFF